MCCQKEERNGFDLIILNFHISRLLKLNIFPTFYKSVLNPGGKLYRISVGRIKNAQNDQDGP